MSTFPEKKPSILLKFIDPTFFRNYVKGEGCLNFLLNNRRTLCEEIELLLRYRDYLSRISELPKNLTKKILNIELNIEKVDILMDFYYNIYDKKYNKKWFYTKEENIMENQHIK